MDDQLSHEQIAIQDLARRFTKEQITDQAGQWDHDHHFPVDVIKAAGNLGFAAMYASPDHGGAGLSRLDAVLVFEAMAYGCPVTSAFISIHNMTAWMIDRFGDPDLKKRFLPKIVTMEVLASYCLTEPSAGSDAASLKTRAERDGDHYILNGSKAFISGAGVSDLYICMVRTGGEGANGISCLIVEKSTPGISFGTPEHKLGWNAQPTAQVHFDDCRVPVKNRIGAEGEGFKIAMSGLDGGRLNIAACSIGGAQRCLDDSIAYVKDRKQFGKTIADFQNTQFMIADMATELEAVRSLLYRTALKVSRNDPDKTRFAAMAKRLATDRCSQIVNDALQLHGGYGYLKDYPVERFFRDLRIHQILEGTNQIMRLIIGRDILKD